VVRFLSEIRQLHKMLSAVSMYPKTPQFEEERTEAALALISSLGRSHRQDMYTKYAGYRVYCVVLCNASVRTSALLRSSVVYCFCVAWSVVL
jgi:hypothetical protein